MVQAAHPFPSHPSTLQSSGKWPCILGAWLLLWEQAVVLVCFSCGSAETSVSWFSPGCMAAATRQSFLSRLQARWPGSGYIQPLAHVFDSPGLKEFCIENPVGETSWRMDCYAGWREKGTAVSSWGYSTQSIVGRPTLWGVSNKDIQRTMLSVIFPPTIFFTLYRGVFHSVPPHLCSLLLLPVSPLPGLFSFL